MKNQNPIQNQFNPLENSPTTADDPRRSLRKRLRALKKRILLLKAGVRVDGQVMRTALRRGALARHRKHATLYFAAVEELVQLEGKRIKIREKIAKLNTILGTKGENYVHRDGADLAALGSRLYGCRL